ncbi:hypothetical protein JYQ62_22775 [Nostoc sp. UHCC 0702]|nr:hypothetical protein JYQ62_22775 [Nostoc sp. UHCC 0702]
MRSSFASFVFEGEDVAQGDHSPNITLSTQPNRGAIVRKEPEGFLKKTLSPNLRFAF